MVARRRLDPERMAKYAPLAAELRRAMTTRGIGCTELAHALSIRPSTLSNYRRSASVPSSAMVAALADILGWSKLIEVSAVLRSRICPVDQHHFFDDSNRQNAVYCSMKCCRTAHTRVVRGDVKIRYVITTRRLARHVAAIDAFCRSCAPDLVCPDATCPIQVNKVSPLPLPRGGVRIVPRPIVFRCRRRA